MERPVLTISCQAKVLPHLRRQWQISQQIERESRPPTASTHTRDSGNKKVRRLLDDVGLDVKRLLIFSAGGHLLSVAGDRAAADEAALRADPRLLMRFLLVMLSLQDPEYDAPRPLRTDKSAATFSNVSRVPRSDCAAQTYELKVLALSCAVLRYEKLYFAVLFKEAGGEEEEGRHSRNLRYLAHYFLLYVMRHFCEHFTLSAIRKITQLEMDAPPARPQAWENLLLTNSKDTLSDFGGGGGGGAGSSNSLARRNMHKFSSGFSRLGSQSPGPAAQNVRDLNVFFNVGLRSFAHSFLRSFKKVFSNINFDRKKTLIQMFVIDKESKSELFRHSFISHTSKHLDFIKSDIMPFLVSNIIDNIEDYLHRKRDEMKGQKMEFEHYFLNKILKVIYLPSWRGLYLVFLVEAHLGITRYPAHISRQIDFRRHIERLRRDRYKCRKTYRVFVGEFRDPMAYEDFIWKYIAQALHGFDPTPETNCFTLQNLRQHFDASVSLDRQSPSVGGGGGIFTNPRNSLYDMIQNLRTPAANSSAYESFFTIDNKTPANMARSGSSFNFSDISKIEEIAAQTPGGFLSQIRRPTPKKKYTIEDSDYGIRSEGVKKKKPSAVRTFADRVDESLQTLEPKRGLSYQPVWASPEHRKVESDLPEMFRREEQKAAAAATPPPEQHQPTEELLQAEMMRYQQAPIAKKDLRDETLHAGGETTEQGQGQGGEGSRELSFSGVPTMPPVLSPGSELKLGLAQNSR